MSELGDAGDHTRQKRLDGKRKGRLVVGVIGVLLSVGYTVEATELAPGTMAQPGAGAFPMLLGGILALTSLLTIWESARATAVTGAVELPRGTDLKRLLGLAAAFVGYVAVLSLFGYALASVAFAVVVLRILGETSWLRTIVLAIVVTVVTYLLFVTVLDVLLPVGVFGS